MIHLVKAHERGHTEIDWLDSRHTFSFGEYHDQRRMGFRALRVINDDRVSPGGGFGTHSHRDMEIVTYVLEGALEHRDSLGTGSVIRAGDVQKMSAGAGILHSEFNHSDKIPVHFLQIWILPNRSGLAPSYQQISVSRERKLGRLCLLAANEQAADLIRIHQDVKLYVSLLETPEQTLTYELPPQRQAWMHIVSGAVTVNGVSMREGDGAAINKAGALEIAGAPAGEFLLFDLA